MKTDDTKTIAETQYLNLVQRGTWFFAQRPSKISVVAIIPLTDDGKLVLVEQFRVPTNSNVIELPAGLAGDIPGQEDEPLETAARRELLEETGYEAGNLEYLTKVVSSAGLTDERVVLFLATDLVKTGEGGGDDSENIIVHEVNLEELPAWLKSAEEEGKDIDARVHGAMHWARMKK